MMGMVIILDINLFYSRSHSILRPFLIPSLMKNPLHFSLLFIFFFCLLTDSPIDATNAVKESDSGYKIIKFWEKLQNGKKTPYDVDSCYGWIGIRPAKGEYIGLGFSPSCKIIQADLLEFPEKYHQANAEYDRFSEDSLKQRNKCTQHHLFILRLHRLDEGGLFSYHYTRVRVIGNKVQVTFFALKDVLLEGESNYHSSSYGHPSVKFFNADEFPSSYSPMNVYSIDYEIYIWFKTNEGLRLQNYRVTWDSTNIDNGYHIDVFKKFAIPNGFIPVNQLTHIITSDVEVHYFFIRDGDNRHNIMMLKHTDLINNDFSRMEMFNTGMKVDVFPRSIVGGIIPFYSNIKGVEHAEFRNNKCRKGSHVIVYKNNSDKNSEGIYKDYLPPISDPPLALNIFATHFRSAYPFVTNGRRIKKPNYGGLVDVIITVFVAALIARLITLGYDVLPTQLARKIRMKLSVKHRYFFKSLAKRSRFFLFLYKTELFIWKNGKKLYNGLKKIAWFEGDNEEEIRPLMASHGQDQTSTRESSTPNE